ncbi:MAG TPA: radical SAM protein [Candidatus Omnitrophota bacterium]|mgnify:CR=1 FL=1|nr:radical SAM protein [Candidatus Omnitrophota bacterium]HPT07142.1 radical SAM protein [Candidatus Omnitrophota bacterium]
MATILLVNCMNFERDVKNKFAWFVAPLGIGYVASYARARGYDVAMIDLRLFDGWEDVIRILLEHKPKIVGLSAMTPEADLAAGVAALVHETLPGTTIVLGGAHATVCPDEAIKIPHVDFLIRAEGEETFVALCDALRSDGDVSGIEGIVWRRGDVIVTNPARPPIANLDSLPFPARDIIGGERYYTDAYELFFPMQYPYLNIMSSRGCFAGCSMCQPTLEMIFGKGVRHRSVANVVAEIVELKTKYGIRSVIFWDDTFTMDKNWVTCFCQALTATKLMVSWWCYARVNTLTDALLGQMKKAGCAMICFGIESGSQRVLTEILHKGTTVEQNRQAIALCKKARVLVNANVMIGSPSETLQEVYLTDRFLEETRPELVWAAITSPLPGTLLGDEARRNGLILARNWSDYARSQVGVPKLKTGIPFETISWYQAQWHTTGFTPRFLFEAQYRDACIARCLCHIRVGEPGRIMEEFVRVWYRSA